MVKAITQADFNAEVLESKKPVFVDFYADWCNPCKMMAPAVEELSQEYGDKAVIGKVNIDENPDLAQKYGVMSIPTFLIFKNGEVQGKLMGAMDLSELEEALNKVL